MTRVSRKFFSYVAPSVLSMWVFSLYSMVDGFFLSKGVGPDALASVNVVMPFVSVMLGISVLFSAGASVSVSIALGKGDLKEGRTVFMVNMVFLFAISSAISLLCLTNLERVVSFLGATPKLAPDSISYFRIIGFFAPVAALSYYLEVLSRADGFPKLATVSVSLAATINIALDYIFVIVMGMGVEGAAFATGIAQCSSTLMMLGHFLGKKTRLSLGLFDVRGLVRRISLFPGLADSITEFSLGTTVFLFNRRIPMVMDESGLISYTVIAYFSTLVVMTMSGISQGMQPLVSYHYGRNDHDHVLHFLKLAMRTALVSSVVWFGVIQGFAGTFTGIFISSQNAPELFDSTARALRLFSSSYLIVGINVVLATFFASVNKSALASLVSLGRGMVLIAISLVAVSSVMGETGLWIAPGVSELLCAAMAGGFFFHVREEKGWDALPSLSL